MLIENLNFAAEMHSIRDEVEGNNHRWRKFPPMRATGLQHGRHNQKQLIVLIVFIRFFCTKTNLIFLPNKEKGRNSILSFCQIIIPSQSVCFVQWENEEKGKMTRFNEEARKKGVKWQ